MTVKSGWVDDFGEYEIPANVAEALRGALRKDGWFDRRKKVARALEGYFKFNRAQRAALSDGGPIEGWTAPGWRLS